MKLYLLVCSTCLLSGATLGHFNGKYSAAAHFVDDCTTMTVVVFHDRQSESNRQFHCFEINTSGVMGVPVTRDPPPQPVI